MVTTERPREPARLDPERSSEEARSFLQRRIGLFTGMIWMLSFGFYFADHVMEQLATGNPNGWLYRGDWAHLAASTVSLVVWGLCRWWRWDPHTLAWLDAAGSIAAGAGFAWMGYEAHHDRAGIFPMILATNHLAFGRAVLVPSSARRTLWIHSGVLLPSIAAAYFNTRLQSPGNELTGAGYVSLWCGVSLVMTTLASRVLYGLRERVRETTRLGQYTLNEKIGEGGMGVVYRASHAMLRRPTAIKLLPPGKSGERSLARFEREVQLTSQLTHPNTVAIYDFGRTPDGIFYYAMEYLDGIDLEALVREHGPQPAGRVIHLLRQIAGALAEAHEVGLIHRDIKPANVILCERGGLFDVAKVVDFGLVKELRPDVQDPNVTSSNALTGTPLYLAPEAITSPESVSQSSDLYALGAVGYYLLAGKNLFDAKTIVEVLAHHLATTPPSPSKSLGTAIAPDLESLVIKCLSKDPDARPATARALDAALSACEDASSGFRSRTATCRPPFGA
jgi:tRNA A-37 threonylcarbamoyl transferase component Bud32